MDKLKNKKIKKNRKDIRGKRDNRERRKNFLEKYLVLFLER